MANATKVELPLNQDKTAAVLAELKRPTDDELKTSQRLSSGRPTDKASTISAFSQAPVSELLVSPCVPPCFCLHVYCSTGIASFAGGSKPQLT